MPISETAAQILAEASDLSMVVNPGHTPASTNPADTTRSPDEIEVDFQAMTDIINRYDAAILAETGRRIPIDARPYWALRYKRAHYGSEHRFAVAKGNT